MQVPAYWPVEAGVQELEYRGVDCELMKTICIELEDEDPMSMPSCLCSSISLCLFWIRVVLSESS